MSIWRWSAVLAMTGVIASQVSGNDLGRVINSGWFSTINAAKDGDEEYFLNRLDIARSVLISSFSEGELEGAIQPSIQKDVSEKVRINASGETLALLIHIGESRKRGYNDYNRGSTKCRGSNSKNIPLTSMTFGEISFFQGLPTCHKSKLLAVGRYQDVDVTRAMKKLGISKNARYSEDAQDYVFAFYLTQSKQPAIRRFITTGKSIKAAGHSVAAEWASIQSPVTGKGLYDGNGTNKAHIKAVRVIEALLRAREEYVRLINSGIPEESAYSAAIGV